MDFSRRGGTKPHPLIWIALAVILAGLALKFGATQEFSHSVHGSILKAVAWAGSKLNIAVPAAAAPSPSPAPAPSPTDPRQQAQSLVETYMHQHVQSQFTITYIDWSNLAVHGDTSQIILHYRVAQSGHDDVFTYVRFTIQNGNVAGADVVQPGALASTFQPVRPPAPAVVIDHFSDLRAHAMMGESRRIELTDAFSLDQLEQAKAAARQQRKPLGFILVWGQLFDQDSDTSGKDSVSALVHFYDVFHDNLVLVFVRHESELGRVPAAVKKGFQGPDEGGYSPNMAVTDATATEFIVEIPYRSLNGEGRDQIFAADCPIIDRWWAAHPDAVAASAH